MTCAQNIDQYKSPTLELRCDFSRRFTVMLAGYYQNLFQMRQTRSSYWESEKASLETGAVRCIWTVIKSSSPTTAPGSRARDFWNCQLLSLLVLKLTTTKGSQGYRFARIRELLQGNAHRFFGQKAAQRLLRRSGLSIASLSRKLTRWVDVAIPEHKRKMPGTSVFLSRVFEDRLHQLKAQNLWTS